MTRTSNDVGSNPTTNFKAIGLSALIMVSFVRSALSESPLPGRDGVVRALRHREQLIQSAVVEYSVRVIETPADRIPRIKEALEAHGIAEKLRGWVTTKEAAAATSYGAKWWRRGIRDRLDCAPAHPEAKGFPFNAAEAFDGQFVRTLSYGSSGPEMVPVATISTAQHAVSTNSDREHPYSMAFEFMGRPHSDLVETGDELTIESVNDGAGKLVRVAVRPASLPKFRIRLFLDDKLALVKREVDSPIRSRDRKQPAPYTETCILEYGQYPDPSGEVILFPRKVLDRRLAGRASDGTPVAWNESLYTITSAHFNVPIPNQQFSLKIPANAKVWDGVNGPGWIGGDRK